MTVSGLIDIARSQIGTVESPANSNNTKYGAAYGTNGVAWCAQFVWWVFREAGHSNLIPKTAYTPTFAQWFKDRKQWGTAPRLGAVVFFDFPDDGVNRISHVGIVEAVNKDDTIVTIEGNTSSGVAGSQRDGGGVWRRTRKTGIVGYGYPAYPLINPATTSVGANEGDNDLTPEQDRLLRDIHMKLTSRHPTRANFAMLGEKGTDYSDDIGGYAINADARAYETRQLVMALSRKLDTILNARPDLAQPAQTTQAAQPAEGAFGLTDEAITRIADAVIAEMGRALS